MSTVEGIGSNTANQWSPALASLGSTLTTYLQDKMLKKIDVDSSGSVGQSEFQAAMEQLTTKLGVDLGEDHSEMFAGLDVDGDGELSGQELGQMIRAAFSAPQNTQDFLAARGNESKPTSEFDALDTDGDGILSRAEFAGPTAASGTTVQSADAASTVTSVTNASYSPSSESPVSTTAVNDPLKTLLSGLDADNNGQVSNSEVDQFIAQLAGQMQLALSQLRDTSINDQQTGASGTVA
ncbi:Ca2+-binding EF-hand superfamily protein [Hydrogenophaga palleronii]|uniref:Ca2+-binding EF-hand superfamily protein n=1 Tax=Hydrogenophaga palleronii TaxID=65655 RepID=A0ABU1WI43_9BURK|nr:EF-hand domain-containing protein [Hydrogenophaga palleronii]MDR7148945.1 Ca2+-binding EF-hand superfamily protein [Hydrogenophaga palleronii]